MKLSNTENAIEIERRDEVDLMIDMINTYLEKYPSADEKEMLIKMKNELFQLGFLW